MSTNAGDGDEGFMRAIPLCTLRHVRKITPFSIMGFLAFVTFASPPPAAEALIMPSLVPIPTNSASSASSSSSNPRTIPLQLHLISIPTAPTTVTPTLEAQTSARGLIPVRNLVKERLVYLVNAERKRKYLLPLRWDPRLDVAAQKHAEDMLIRHYISHLSPDNTTPLDRIEAAGFKPPTCNCTFQYYYGENIGWGQRSADQVMQMWMQSPDHREHILDPNFVDVGVGQSGLYWVLDFGGLFYR